MNARIPEAVAERPVDKARAVAHYGAMAAEAAKLADCRPANYWSPADRQALRQIQPSFVTVPFRSTEVSCKVEVTSGHDHEADQYDVTAVQIGGTWFDAFETLSSHFLAELQAALDAMPSNR